MPTRKASRPSIEPVANSSKRSAAFFKFITSSSLDDTIKLTSWDNVSKTYLASTGSNTGDLSGTSVVYCTGSSGISGATSNNSSSAIAAATALKDAITSTNGHYDKFTVYANDETNDLFLAQSSTAKVNAGITDHYTGSGAVIIVQNKEGVVGNKAVIHTITSTTITGSVIGFTGGKDTTFVKIHNNY